MSVVRDWNNQNYQKTIKLKSGKQLAYPKYGIFWIMFQFEGEKYKNKFRINFKTLILNSIQ